MEILLLEIDLLTQIDGVIFDECFANKKEVNIEDVQVNFISYDDLRKNKAATGTIKRSNRFGES